MDYGITELAIGGVPVAVFVFVIVQALKWSNLLRTPTAIRITVLVASVIGAAVWAAMTLFPEIGPYAQVLFTALTGAALATLGYEGLDRLRSRSTS